MTVFLNPGNKLSRSAVFEGGTKAFMSSELFVPSMFGVRNSIPTPETDIYAFGFVTFQVRELDLGCGMALTLPKSSLANSHSAVPVMRTWHGLWFMGRAQLNQRTPYPSGFPIYCGVLSSVAGMAT